MAVDGSDVRAIRQVMLDDNDVAPAARAAIAHRFFFRLAFHRWGGTISIRRTSFGSGPLTRAVCDSVSLPFAAGHAVQVGRDISTVCPLLPQFLSHRRALGSSRQRAARTDLAILAHTVGNSVNRRAHRYQATSAQVQHSWSTVISITGSPAAVEFDAGSAPADF